ncbi:SPFH domain-containing protein [Winogradskyella eckloniae]|uniref:SPFH domain-containing protein n=1 Tax=Winogradskyella eckloniae TaxID=1089306 RepID=UPI001566123C|nr:SPFH domain-containing protein [Winogradskyella eckloniae]NRD20855.1 SPFH domain-containing protein [Winogradskyella eckloniae]
MGILNQMRSVIQWESPQQYQLFYKFTDRGDELKNASKLILQEGQGCVFTYEGKIEGVFDEAGIYDLKTDNKPFITTIKKLMNAFESEHKTGIWFYRKVDMLNIRWGTRIPITYNDPVYAFPVHLRGYGNYSLKITEPKNFFINVLAGQSNYYVDELQEIFLSRITQPISNYLANAKFSYAEIDSNIENIARETQERTVQIFEELGFQLLDFRIEGTSFDKDTNKRIDEISNMQAEVKAANIAGVDYAELQKLKAMRDMAKNEGMAGTSMGMFAGMNMGNTMQANTSNEKKESAAIDIRSKLKDLKALFEDELISEEEFLAKKKDLLDSM